MNKTLITVAGASAALVAVATTVPAQATGGHSQAPKQAAFAVVAQGLHGPRGLTFAHGDLYVAEAGQGGDGPCIVGGEGPSCYGRTGSVTRVHDGKQRRGLQRAGPLGKPGTPQAPGGPAPPPPPGGGHNRPGHGAGGGPP